MSTRRYDPSHRARPLGLGNREFARRRYAPHGVEYRSVEREVSRAEAIGFVSGRGSQERGCQPSATH